MCERKRDADMRNVELYLARTLAMIMQKSSIVQVLIFL